MWGLLGSREFAAARTEGWLQYHGWLQTETPTTDANAMWTWCNLHMEHMKTTIKQPTSRIWIVHTLKTLVGWSFLHGWLTSINWGSWGHNCRIFSFSTSPVPGVPGSKAWIVLHQVLPTPLDQQMLKTARLDVSKSGLWQVRMGKLPNESPMRAIFGGNKTTSDWFPKNCAPQSGPMGPKLGENHGIDVLQVRIAIPILSHGHVCVCLKI